MKFILTIDTDNAAFHEGSLSEHIADHLINLAERIIMRGVDDQLPILDANGNRVGEYTYG